MKPGHLVTAAFALSLAGAYAWSHTYAAATYRAEQIADRQCKQMGDWCSRKEPGVKKRKKTKKTCFVDRTSRASVMAVVIQPQ